MKNVEKGVAMLEAVGVMGVLLTALVSAFAVSIWMARSYALSHLLDRVLVDSSVTPVTLRADGTMELDHNKLQNFVEIIADSLERELLNGDLDDTDAELLSSDYLIQVGYVEAKFNTASGAFISFAGGAAPSPFSYLTARGDLAPTDEYLMIGDVREEFSAFTAEGGIPLVNGRFLHTGAFLGAVIYFYSHGGLAPYFFSLSGREPILVRSKVVSLRGGIGV